MKVGQALRLESRLTGGGFDVHHKGKDVKNTLLRKVWKPSDELVTFYQKSQFAAIHFMKKIRMCSFGWLLGSDEQDIAMHFFPF